MMNTQRVGVLVGAVAALMLVLAGCTSGPSSPTRVDAGATVKSLARNADGYADMNVRQLAGLLPEKDFTMVNVHVPYEGEIPQTDLFIPFDQVAQNLDKLPGKDAPILLYCRSGSMSTQAAKSLAELGYTNVMELDGGFTAWKAAGYELVNQQQ